MLVFVVFYKESRIWEGKKLIPTKQLSIFFTMNFVLECTLKTLEATNQGYSFKLFFSKAAKSLKKTCKGVHFLAKLQVESLELH